MSKRKEEPADASCADRHRLKVFNGGKAHAKRKREVTLPKLQCLAEDEPPDDGAVDAPRGDD
jgi:hypothetical protein